MCLIPQEKHIVEGSGLEHCRVIEDNRLGGNQNMEKTFLQDSPSPHPKKFF
jgi:hypothetical protein